ncbi:MAG: hypothetical protein LBG97_08560 [Coriobacteriales bacterium]|jgi:hypothetical protein|nr:hypothetical protein [Coriobacteriales bacterium]
MNQQTSSNDTKVGHTTNTPKLTNGQNNKTEMASSRIGGTAAAFRYLLATNVIWALFFLGALALFFTGATILRYFIGSVDSSGYPWLAYGALLGGANTFYMFVLGLCWAFYMPWLMPYGLTRKQFVLANLFSALILITALTLLSYLLQVVIDHNLTAIDPFVLKTSTDAIASELQSTDFNFAAAIPTYSLPDDFLYLLSSWVYTLFVFLLGWIIAIGFLLRRILTAAGGIIIALSLMAIISLRSFSVYIGPTRMFFDFTGTSAGTAINSISPVIWPFAMLLLCALLFCLLLRVSRHIPIKC